MAEILVVEDYPPMASLLTRLLRHQGHHVTREYTMAGALHQAAAFEYAVLDINLPDGNGVALAEHLFEQHRVNNVLFFTATRDAKTLARAEQLGPVVSKTSGTHRLLEALELLEQISSPCGGPVTASVWTKAGTALERTRVGT